MDSGEPPCGLLFAAAHLGNPGENPLGIASVFLIGVIFATTIWLTGNLWLSVGIHAGVVLAEDLIFSVPDSGAVYSGHLLVRAVSWRCRSSPSCWCCCGLSIAVVRPARPT
jgi:membrane protease YdiL (CAAX protease family)